MAFELCFNDLYSSLCQCGVLVPMQHFRGVHNTFGCVGWLGRMAAVLGTFRGVHSTFSWRYPGAPGASTQRAHAGLRVGPGAHGGSAPRGDSLACAGKGLRWAGKCCIRFPLACAAKGLRWIGKCCISTGDCTCPLAACLAPSAVLFVRVSTPS